MQVGANTNVAHIAAFACEFNVQTVVFVQITQQRFLHINIYTHIEPKSLAKAAKNIDEDKRSINTPSSCVVLSVMRSLPYMQFKAKCVDRALTWHVADITERLQNHLVMKSVRRTVCPARLARIEVVRPVAPSSATFPDLKVVSAMERPAIVARVHLRAPLGGTLARHRVVGGAVPVLRNIARRLEELPTRASRNTQNSTLGRKYE